MFSAASLFSFVGVLFTSFSPVIVLSVTTVSTQPMYLVLAIFAAFFWSCAISVAAIVWTILVPLRSMLWLLVLYAVVLQELARWGTYALFERLMRGLRSAGLTPTELARTPPAQVVPAAVAAGVGAGVMQVLTMHGDVLAGSLRPGTLYTPSCDALSLFAVDALTNLASITLNVLLSIIGWTAAYPRGSVTLWAALLGLHALAASATLLNTQLPGLVPAGQGCAYSLPSLYTVVLIAAAITARVAATSMCAPRLSEATSAAAATSTRAGRE